MVTAIVVKDGDRIIQGEMFVMGEGLKTSQEMKKYRHVNYQPSLYYDKQSGMVIDRDAQLQEKAYMDAVQTNIVEGIIKNPFIKRLRFGGNKNA